MNTVVRNVVVGGSMFLLFWAGCSDDEPKGDGPTGPAASTGPTSTGTVMMNTSSSVNPMASSSSSSTGGGMVYECNPVTNEPCAGQDACDFSADNKFSCFNTQNTQAICQMCDNANGPFCQGTMSCNGGDGICRRYCCDDTDCGPSLMCDKTAFPVAPEVGVCVGNIGAGGGGGAGTGGGGAGGGPPITGCTDVPAIAPSMGACVPFP